MLLPAVREESQPQALNSPGSRTGRAGRMEGTNPGLHFAGEFIVAFSQECLSAEAGLGREENSPKETPPLSPTPGHKTVTQDWVVGPS